MIDTPGIVEENVISEANLLKIKNFLKQNNKEIDIILFCERMDIYHVELIDRKIFQYLSKYFGTDLWRRTILAMTRAGVTNIPNGMSYQKFINRRSLTIKQVVYKKSSIKTLSVVYIENLRTRIGYAGQLLLPNGTAWILNLAKILMECLESFLSPYRYNLKQEKRIDSQNNLKCLIPIIFYLQLLSKDIARKLILSKNDRQISARFDDSCQHA